MDESQKNYVGPNKPAVKVCMWYDSIYMKL